MNNILGKKLGFCKEFAICLAIALAARGSMIFGLNLSADDFGFLSFSDKIEIWPFALEMRILSFYVMLMLNSVGASVPFVGFFWSILFTASYVIFGLVSMRVWVPQAGSLEKIAGASLFFLFPYHSDYLSYFIAAPAISTMLVFGCLSMYFCVNGKKCGFLSILGLTYAVSGQITFVYLFIFVVFGIFICFFKGISEENFEKAKFLQMGKTWFTRLAFLLFSAIIYVFINKLIIFFLGLHTGSRLVFADLVGLKDNLIVAAKQIYFFFLKEDVAQPVAVKIAQLGFFISIILSGICTIFRHKTATLSRIALWVLSVLIVILSMVLILGAVLPLKEPPLNPRTLSALGVYWAGVFALACSVTFGRIHTATVFLGVFVAFCYAINANRQAVDFARINQRDRLVANRMVERLSLLDGFSGLRTVVLTPTEHRFNLDRISTESSGFNVSSLYRNWSSAAVLREVSGWLFLPPTEHDRQRAEKAAAGKPPWPLAGSVFIEGDIGVVVLPQMENQAFKN